MNVNDVKVAAEDLVESNTASPLEGVCVKGLHGAELINGFEVVEANEFAGVFVLDSSGEPAVSSRVIKQKDAEIERLKRENVRLYNLMMMARGHTEMDGRFKRYKGETLV